MLVDTGNRVLFHGSKATDFEVGDLVKVETRTKGAHEQLWIAKTKVPMNSFDTKIIRVPLLSYGFIEYEMGKYFFLWKFVQAADIGSLSTKDIVSFVLQDDRSDPRKGPRAVGIKLIKMDKAHIS